MGCGEAVRSCSSRELVGLDPGGAVELLLSIHVYSTSGCDHAEAI